mgnify:CR=1 FL=1
MSAQIARLAEQIGVDPKVLLAIQKVESSSSPRKVRFEPHLFHRDTSNRYVAQIPWTKSRGNVSLVSSETNREAFERAYRLDPAIAVRSSSWGRYQILGGAGIALFGSPPAFVAAFDENPDLTSDQLLVKWFSSRPNAIAAANAKDWPRLAQLYNGSSTSPWLGRFIRAYEGSGTGGAGAFAWVLGAALAGGLGARWVRRRQAR